MSGEKPHFRNLRHYALGASLVWTLATATAAGLNGYLVHEQALNDALIRTRALFERDLLYRHWNASHGGVYVPLTSETPQNPFLPKEAEGVVTTTTGRRLTLVNPAYMSRQVYRMGDLLTGVKGHLTSRHPRNPENAPDAWESAALEAFEGGETEVASRIRLDGREYLRLMRPFRIEKDCLRCHGDQGYREGDIRGGLTISLPLEDLLAHARRHALFNGGGYLVLWLLGLGGIRLGQNRFREQIASSQRSHHLRRRTRKRLTYLAHYDRVTGLPNRVLFNDRLRLALAGARRYDGHLAVAVLGLDHFRMINHSFGLENGDLLLKQAAIRLSGCLRELDTAARHGDGRFLLLFSNIRRGEDAATIAGKIREAFAPPFQVAGQEIFLTVSLGIALYPEDGRQEKELLCNADAALSRAREMGTGTLEFYSASMNGRAMEQITLESRLRQALDLGQFYLHYQPQVDSRNGAVSGVEALIRWHHPEMGVVPPDHFIPVAEECGLIVAIGEWVLRTACRQVAEWERLHGRPLAVAVNLSPRQFMHPDLVDLVDRILAETGLRPECLELEIVESSVIQDIERAIETLTDLKVRGIRVAIDDFGTGYSSLNYLKRLPIDRIKIDRSFVRDFDSDRGDGAIIALIAEISRKMGLELIAEGVETTAQRDFLLESRCYQMQGYLFSRPLPPEACAAFLQQTAVSPPPEA